MGAVTKAVNKAVEKGIVAPVTKVGQTVGVIDKPKTAQPAASAPAPVTPAAAAVKSISQAADEAVLARRRARRGGRALLSEARLTPEAGVGQTTLGSGPSI